MRKAALVSLALAMLAGYAMGDDAVGSTSTLYKSVSPSVVTITVSGRDGRPIASGSGVIVSTNGRILTNYHVVSGGVFFDVKIPGNPEALPARATKCAPSKDLALLSVTSDRPLRPARLSKQRPSVGARVVAVGSPLSLEGSITDGVVSQFRSEAGVELIQTTTPISPGSSGGGLFTLGGELAGITTMTLKSGQALNFAVAVGEMKYLVPCDDFPEMPSEDSEPSTPMPTPTPSTCPDFLRLGKAFGEFSAEQTKATAEWLSALRRRSPNQPMPDANYHHDAALATLRLLASDITTGRYASISTPSASLLLTTLAMLKKYDAMVSAIRAAHTYTRSVQAMNAAEEAVGEYQPAYQTYMRAIVALSEETDSSCPNWAKPVYDELWAK